jgi:Na+-transporting methylmalonyl-CoA/oxaloacetate decarboxylase beta subunit
MPTIFVFFFDNFIKVVVFIYCILTQRFIIFMGVGALTDFGPLLANPKTLLLGAAAQ